MSIERFQAPPMHAVSRYVTLGGYNEKTEQPNPKKAEGHLIAIGEEPNKFEEGKMRTFYVLRTTDGDIQLNGTSDMNRNFQFAANQLAGRGENLVGSWVSVEYGGLKPGTKVKLFNVSVNTKDSIDPTAPAAHTTSAATQTTNRSQVEALLKKTGSKN